MQQRLFSSFLRFSLFLYFFLYAAVTVRAQAGPAPGALRTEYLVNPLGIDAARPRLSWQMRDGRTGARQTAFELVVGVDSAAVAKGGGSIWKTGKR
ncbi:MAG TPA: hypothetical protein VHK69_19715, partial [Chitinophagaceae bacterium]|nr:hypothetical protein [Chitinophagaceae bacterium]